MSMVQKFAGIGVAISVLGLGGVSVAAAGPGGGGGCRLEVAAELLDSTVEELDAIQADGGSIREMLEEAEFTEEEIIAAREAVDCERPEPSEEQIEALATELSLTPEELQSRIEAGESIRDIAEAQGVELEGRGGHGGPRELSEERLAELAAELEMSVEELQSRIEAGESIRDIAEEQGVELEGRGGRGGPRELSEERLAELAAELDMSVEELQSRIEAGESIRDIAAEQGVELEGRGPGGPDGRGGRGGGLDGNNATDLDA